MSSITANQVKIINTARRQVEKISGGTFDEDAWRLLLRNAGGIEDAAGRISSKTLNNSGFEKVMDYLEEKGFRHPGKPEDYWRRNYSRRSGFATKPQVWEIRRLAPMQQYPLQVICRRVSNDQHSEPERLTTDQARKLIEALKSITRRQTADEEANGKVA